MEDKKKRSSGLYTADKSALVKRSDENPVVLRLYEDGVLKVSSHQMIDSIHQCWGPGLRPLVKSRTEQEKDMNFTKFE